MGQAITTGDIRKDFARNMRKLLEDTMNESNRKYTKPYYIMICSDWDGDTSIVNTKAIVMPVRPSVDLVATMLFKANPVSGEYTMEYCKPRDIPTGHVQMENKRGNTQDVLANNAKETFTPLIH